MREGGCSGKFLGDGGIPLFEVRGLAFEDSSAGGTIGLEESGRGTNDCVEVGGCSVEGY